jgi:cyclophilin family peptidyl-prolyl cis-trans isomerase
MIRLPISTTVLIASLAIQPIVYAQAAKPQTAKPQTAKPDFSKAKLRTPAALKETAPATYKANFDTSAGVFVIEVHRDWAPREADRFFNLVKNGFYDDCRFFRVIPNFMVQFGINGNPAVTKAWQHSDITDDPVKQSNKRGFVSFAQTGAPNSRSTQVFINYVDRNTFLDHSGQGFAPFGQVVTGMDVVDKLYSGYAENAQNQSQRIEAEGNAFLTKSFPKLDYIKKATIEK